MTNSNETVRDVCAEIQLQRYQTAFAASDVIGWRDRILAAYEREMKRMHECCDSLEDEFDAKDAEIARLKAALKLVMECDLTDVDASLNCILMSSHNAVREAQRVMREGGEK